MEEDEIEGWYEDEKQNIVDDYLKELDDGVPKQNAEEKYKKNIASVIERYNSLMNEKLDKKKKGKLGNLIFNIKARLLTYRKKQ